VDVHAPHLQPSYNLISHLIYAAGRGDVTDTYVAGRALMRDRRLLTVDEDAAIAKAGEWRARIKP
jgi:5-methylthioadenosine/S-adenosylhomocysteine deaminase